MSKMIKCDACGKVIDFSKKQARENVEVDEVGFVVHIEVLNRYKIPESSVRYPALMPMPVTKDDNLDLCPECFAKVITALRARLGERETLGKEEANQ